MSQALKSLTIAPFIPLKPQPAKNEELLKFSTTRSNALEQYIKAALAKDREFFRAEAESLQVNVVLLQNQKILINERLENNKQEQSNLEQEFKQALDDKSKFHTFVPVQSQADIEKQIVSCKKRIVQLNKMRYEEAQSISISDFEKLNIKNKDRDSPLNELFIWAIQILYKEAATNYFWINFKQEVFMNDKGEDFKERLGRVKAIDMKEEELEKTLAVIKLKDKIINCELAQLGNLKVQIERIFKIIDLIMQTEDIGIEVHKYEKDLKELIAQQQKNQADKERVENRLVVLSDKKEFITMLTDQYLQFSKEIDAKISSIQKIQTLNSAFVDKMDKSFFSLEYTKATS